MRHTAHGRTSQPGGNVLVDRGFLPAAGYGACSSAQQAIWPSAAANRPGLPPCSTRDIRIKQANGV